MNDFFFPFILTAQRKSYSQYAHRDIFLYISFFCHVDVFLLAKKGGFLLFYLTEILLLELCNYMDEWCSQL